MAKMILVGGEKDGLGQDGELTMREADLPEVFYAVPNVDEQKIVLQKGNQAKRELRDKLATLAYQHDPKYHEKNPETSTEENFYMVRTPARDKVNQD